MINPHLENVNRNIDNSSKDCSCGVSPVCGSSSQMSFDLSYRLDPPRCGRPWFDPDWPPVTTVWGGEVTHPPLSIDHQLTSVMSGGTSCQTATITASRVVTVTIMSESYRDHGGMSLLMRSTPLRIRPQMHKELAEKGILGKGCFKWSDTKYVL